MESVAPEHPGIPVPLINSSIHYEKAIMKKSLVLTALVLVGVSALIGAARWFDLVGFIKHLHGIA